nr:hypothetical protein [Salinisphaera sp. G21_0]
MSTLSCFKAYDIRGRMPDELNEDIAWRIGRATAEYLKPKTMVVGGDIRLSTPELKTALSDGLRAGGVDVIDIGLCGTEEVYFATSHLKADGGIMVTASHNPKDYNGMKLVREESKPISGDTGLREMSLAGDFFATEARRHGGTEEKIRLYGGLIGKFLICRLMWIIFLGISNRMS